MIFAIRVTNKLDLGIGHLMRMKLLAVELQELGVKVHILLDEECAFSKKAFTDFIVTEVDYKNEAFGAQQTIVYLKEHFITHLIIDSYSLSIEYECQIRDHGFIVTIVDDNEREHDCDYLIDYKWVGNSTYQRYADKVPSSCVKLLGPEYCIIDSEYRREQSKKPRRDKATVLFSLGGGGDLYLISQIIEHLNLLVPGATDYYVVVGPYAQNKESVYQLCDTFDNVTLIEGATCLKQYYVIADLFVGALGTSFYECAATRTPAITFSLEENQNNDVEILEWLGHYLHINNDINTDIPAFAQLINVVLTNLSRLESLISTRSIDVDGFGAVRVAKALTGSYQSKPTRQVPARHLSVVSKLTEDYSICVADDCQINHYLKSRNLASNADKMTIQNTICPIDHYMWWFKQNRSNYMLVEHRDFSNAPQLYIWHQLNEDKYLYGGWFTAVEDVGLAKAMMALKWQLNYCKELYPEAIWLAVIHKENKFVNLLNQYMGFIATEKGSDEYRKSVELFPRADERFNFVMWAPDAQ